MLDESQRFSIIPPKKRIWAFGSIHSDYKRLKTLHNIIAGAVAAGDYFVYMGNIIGIKEGVKETFAEIIDFKSKIKQKFPEITDENFIFLRGRQEEMWQKMLYIHLSDKDDKVYEFLIQNGAEGTLKSFGFNPQDGIKFIEKGTVTMSNWTEKIREVFYKNAGYKEIFSNLKHAAFIQDKAVLFVNSGINHDKPLALNKDEFWWGGHNFIQEKPYQDFGIVVRGYSPVHDSGIYEDEYYITINNRSTADKERPIYALFFNEHCHLESGIEV